MPAEEARRLVRIRQASRGYAAEHALREILREVQNRASVGQTSLCWELRTRHMWLPVRPDQETAAELVRRLRLLRYDSELLWGRFVYVGWAGAEYASDDDDDDDDE